MRRPIARVAVLLAAGLLLFGGPAVLAAPGKGNSCPPPTPGFPDSPTPGCGHGRETPPPPPPPECTDIDEDVVVEVPAGVVYVCLVLLPASPTGENDPICPAGTIETGIINASPLAKVCAVVTLPSA